MKIILLFLALALGGCDSKEEHAQVRAMTEGMQFSPDSLNEEETQKIVIKAKGISLARLRESFLLIKYSEQSSLSKCDTINGFEYAIKTIKKGVEYELKPKVALAGGQSYGLYLKEKNSCSLKHKFFIKRAPPKLLSHDLGIGEWPVVAKNRIYFSFIFDQEIILKDEKSVQLESSDKKALEIEKIIVRSSKKMIELQINTEQLQLSGKYQFQFSKISNLDAREASLNPVKFMVGRGQMLFKEQAPANYLVSDRDIELSWVLNNDHHAEVFFGRDTASTDCLGTPCPRDFPTSLFRPEKNGYLSKMVLPDLEASSDYYVIVRARDHQGTILLSSGMVRTAPSTQISFSEILVDPDASKVENSGEFIEYFNFSQNDLEFLDLGLVLEDPGASKECIIASKKSPLLWPKESYLVIVGGDFDASRYALSDNAQLIRLKQKSLCGGLSNNKAKTIKLVDEHLRVLDRYNGHLWPGQADQSIKKLNLRGLNEAPNYCYSSPSPGATGEGC